MKVSNLISPKSGRPVANQFVIIDVDAAKKIKRIVFQSYETVICEILVDISVDWCCYTKSICINRYYVENYSGVRTRTTTRNFNYFLAKYCMLYPNVRLLLEAAVSDENDVVYSSYELD